jgi:hypothetical protein
MASTKKHPAKSPAGKKRPGGKSGSDASLRKHLVELLNGGSAHASIADAVADFPAVKRGAFAPGLPHTGWQLLEHIRLAQWDILEFSRNPKHESPEFPAGYWPKSPSPAYDAAWDNCVRAISSDLRAMIRLVNDARMDLHAALPWGDGQTLLREALLVADHNAYHAAQLVDLRRALGVWGNQ